MTEREDWHETENEPEGTDSTLRALAPRVLVAEDDTQMRAILVEALDKDGYEVMRAGDGDHLLAYIDYLRGVIVNGRFFDVDLIISDIRMPGASGLEVLAELRKYDRITPVILITAFGDEQTHKEASRLGASAVLDKPIDIDTFRAFVRQILPPLPQVSTDYSP